MALFSRKKAANSGGVPNPGALQVPDELAEKAALLYGNGDFPAALETYGAAIDKLHTMCVAAAPGSRIRTPGPQDQPILDGFNNSLGATLSMNAQASVAQQMEQSTAYLRQIAAEAGAESTRYLEAVANIESTYRLGTSG
jgi:hypothetical protein